MVLGTGPAAARLLWRAVTPRLGSVEPNGILVSHRIVFRMQGTDDLVVQNPLIIIHIASVIGEIAVQVTGQFRKVVGTAGLINLGSLTGNHAGHLGVWFP